MNEETAQGLLNQMQTMIDNQTNMKAQLDATNERVAALELVQAPIDQPHDDTTTTTLEQAEQAASAATDALRRARRQSRSMPIKGSLLDASMMSDKDLLGNSVDDKLPDASDDADKTTNTTNGYTYTGILWANANAFISDNNNNKTNEERRRERERGKNKTPIVSTMITGANLARCSELRRRRRSRSQLRAS